MKKRQWIRVIHLIGAGSLGALVYSPWRTNDVFLLFNQVAVVPVVTATGLWLWLGHRFRSFRKRKSVR